MDLFICIVLDHNVNQKKHSKSLTLLCCEQHPFSQILPLICVCDKQPYLGKLGYSCHPSSDFRASKEVGWFGCFTQACQLLMSCGHSPSHQHHHSRMLHFSPEPCVQVRLVFFAAKTTPPSQHSCIPRNPRCHVQIRAPPLTHTHITEKQRSRASASPSPTI